MYVHPGQSEKTPESRIFQACWRSLTGSQSDPESRRMEKSRRSLKKAERHLKKKVDNPRISVNSIDEYMVPGIRASGHIGNQLYEWKIIKQTHIYCTQRHLNIIVIWWVACTCARFVG
jgi:hypothetical protein